MGSSQITLSFASISGRKIEADFDGGTTTSDGGALLLRQAESKIGIVDRIVGALCDRRHQSYIDHTYIDLIKQRVFQIACSRTDLYRIALALLETFIESYDQPPRKIILDIDDTDDATHGAQQLSLFHAYHDESCYMPVHLYEGGTGKLITAILKRVLDHILMAWPQVQITLRGDSHFSAPEVHDLCDAYDVDFILGQANNKKLKALGAPLMEQAAALAQQTEEPVRLFTSFDYRAGSWSRPRIIIYKAEITQGKTNPRFVVTNIRNRTPKFLYEKVYCARGRMEGFIKNHKTFLHSDRTSCHRFPANQFRLFLHSAAYVLLHAIKHIGMQGTQWTTSNFDTIQLRVLKIGARVREQATRIRFHFPTSYPLKDLMKTIVLNLDTA